MLTIRSTALVPAVVIAWAICGCGGSTPETVTVRGPQSSPSSISKGAAPEWVLKLPRKKGRICAIGAVDPTFFQQDGLKNAAEAARTELARAVQVKISSVMYDYQDEMGSYVEQSSVQEVVGSISDVVLSGAEVEESWFDELGSVQRKGMTYALACMSTSKSAAEFAEKLKSIAPEGDKDAEKKIEEVRQRAKDAFDELEAMEDGDRVPAQDAQADAPGHDAQADPPTQDAPDAPTDSPAAPE